MIAAAHDGQMSADGMARRRRRVELQFVFEVERLKLAAFDGRDDFGNRAGAEHDIDGELLAHAAAFGQLRETAHQADRHPAAPALFLFAQLAEQGLRLFDRLAAHGAGIDQHEIGFAVIINERITDTRQFRLNGVRVVLVHLTTEGNDVRSHTLLVRLL